MRRSDKANHAVISQYQFSGKGRKDPTSDTRSVRFGGAPGAKTMRVDSGKGLPATQKKHRHRRHNAPRSKRAR